MKVCKNCGRQTEDGKVRCPFCGYLFEENMDSVLRKMRENLNQYKESVAKAPVQGSAPAASVQTPPAPIGELPSVQPAPAAQPVQAVSPVPVQAVPPVQAQGQIGAAVQDGGRERFELLTEVAQLKGELRALHTEIDRMHAGAGYAPQQALRQNAAAQPVPAAGPASYAQAVPYGAPQAQSTQAVPYGNQPAQYAQAVPYGNQPAQYAQSGGSQGQSRSTNRIVLSVLCLLLLGLSVGMFFMAWFDPALAPSFKGFGGVLYIFDKSSSNADAVGFAAFLQMIQAHEFAGGEMIANICRNACLYIVEYGVLVYACLLVLGIPLLFSLSGKISCKGWHRFTAWMSFIVALILFGVFCWVAGFSAITLWFLIGAAANFVRCLFLIFYRGKNRQQGGLQ